jgi:hypothetical protein
MIRPSDYNSIMRSADAYLPSTQRYISNFHVWTETIALLLFIPEFMCLFIEQKCGSIFPFSLTASCKRALYGPDKIDAFYGQAFLCLMRLRIFGLVRHWENMWLNNTFVRIKGKDGVWSIKRSRGLLIPQGRLYTEKANAVAITESVLIEESTKKEEEISNDPSNETSITHTKSYTDDIHLTNASKIGTALLTTNAQRGLIVM